MSKITNISALSELLGEQMPDQVDLVDALLHRVNWAADGNSEENHIELEICGVQKHLSSDTISPRARVTWRFSGIVGLTLMNCHMGATPVECFVVEHRPDEHEEDVCFWVGDLEERVIGFWCKGVEVAKAERAG